MIIFPEINKKRREFEMIFTIDLLFFCKTHLYRRTGQNKLLNFAGILYFCKKE